MRVSADKLHGFAMELVEKALANDYDLILLDILMPQMDGFEVLRRLRSDPATADLRVVILSALNTTEDIVKGFNLGANDFITKPIIMEKLISSVSDQLRLSRKGASDPSL